MDLSFLLFTRPARLLSWGALEDALVITLTRVQLRHDGGSRGSRGGSLVVPASGLPGLVGRRGWT